MSLQNCATRLLRISSPSGGTCRMGSQPLGATLRIEKPRDIGQLVRHPVSWQRLQENFTIGHALEAGIHQPEHAPDDLRSKPPPKSLVPPHRPPPPRKSCESA